MSDIERGTRYDAVIERIKRGHHVRGVSTALVNFTKTKLDEQATFMMYTDMLDANPLAVGDTISFDWGTPHDHYTILKIRGISNAIPIRSVEFDPDLWTRVVRSLGHGPDGVKQP